MKSSLTATRNEKCEHDYPQSKALVAFFLQKDSKNVEGCSYVQRLPAASCIKPFGGLSAIEKGRYVMTSSLRQ